MESHATTVVIVPHERFSIARRNLGSVLAHTGEPHRLVYVDGGSPPDVAGYLEEQAGKHDFTLVRTDYYLKPNEGRNLGLRYVDTEFVALVDNDVVVEPGWLPELERCARETGAAVVAPLCCIGPHELAAVHISTGECHIIEMDERRVMHERFFDSQASFVDVRARARRTQCELIDAHAMLIRADALFDAGGFDEEILLEEHCDLALTIRERRGTLWLQPQATVTYLTPRHLAPSDLPYYVARWSEAWNRAGLDHFAAKWDLSADDPWLVEKALWASAHRLRGYRPYRSPFGRVLSRFHRAPHPVVDRVAQRLALQRYAKQRARSVGPRIAHAATWLAGSTARD